METHAFITDEGFNRSDINDSALDFRARYGFDRLEIEKPFDNQNPVRCALIDPTSVAFRNGYIDANASWLATPNGNPRINVFGRCPTLFEQLSMPPGYTGLLPNPIAEIGRTGWLRMRGWLMRGAVREDDYQSGKYDNPNLMPDQDPWVDEYRSVHHFYEPISNTTGLGTVGNFFAGATRSTTWALGIADTANWENVQLPDAARGNHFSYADARRLMFLALTYKSPVIINAEDSGRLRTNIWATTFKSLGHVVHLLQDSAQPQHVRGEGHSFLCNGAWYEDFFSEAPIPTRTFENYTNFRVAVPWNRVLIQAGLKNRYSFSNFCDDNAWRNMFETAGRSDPRSPATWVTNPYPIPQFSVQRKFFTTRTEDANINARRGMADYANRGFFTEGAFLASSGLPNPALPSPPNISDPGFVAGEFGMETIPSLGTINTQVLSWAVPDAVAPNFADTGLQNGKAPIVSRSLWSFVIRDLDAPPIFVDRLGGNLSLTNYEQIADMVAPRAIAYTTGLINFFFRGKLEIEPITQRIFGVMNQGEPHFMENGYPIRTSNGKIFGFEKIRLKIRNATDVIIESGTNQNVPQVVGTGKLVAVARYHRNPCYKPDLSGERVVGFTATPPATGITEPVCPDGLRTNYQEISVSAPLQINSAADLPGGAGGDAPATVEKLFDFSADPIPVNATDLFIQVVYRGQLGEETDGIAVGIVDVQEPTFVAAWNNTDYYFSDVGQNWLVFNDLSFPKRSVDQFDVCAGSPSIIVYRFLTADGMGGLQFPAAPPLNAGVSRLAFINLKQRTLVSSTPYRVIPQMFPPPSARLRTFDSKGQLRQASREIYTAADPLPVPTYCQAFPPSAEANVWCFDPIQRRRGQPMGDALTPIFYNSQTGVGNATDVDAPPAQPVLPGLRPRAGGTVLFDINTPFIPCPLTGPPAQEKRIEQIEEAMQLGVDLKH